MSLRKWSTSGCVVDIPSNFVSSYKFVGWDYKFFVSSDKFFVSSDKLVVSSDYTNIYKKKKKKKHQQQVWRRIGDVDPNSSFFFLRERARIQLGDRFKFFKIELREKIINVVLAIIFFSRPKFQLARFFSSQLKKMIYQWLKPIYTRPFSWRECLFSWWENLVSWWEPSKYI